MSRIKKSSRQKLLLFISLRAAKNYLVRAHAVNIEPKPVNDPVYNYSVPKIPLASSYVK